MKKTIEITTAIPLEVGIDDFPAAVRSRAKAVAKGTDILADRSTILDALPTAIARRVREIMPPEFDIKELEIAFHVKGEIFGSGFGGDVKVKYAPKTK